MTLYARLDSRWKESEEVKVSQRDMKFFDHYEEDADEDQDD